MKNKILLPGAALVLMLAGCAKESVETVGDAKIAYKAAVGQNKTVESRASEIGGLEALEAIDKISMPVWVYFSSGTSSDKLFNTWNLQLVTSPTKHWSYNNDHDVFHPQDGLTHFSVWPVTNVADNEITGQKLYDVNTTNNSAKFDYLVPNQHEQQEDLLGAVAATTYGAPTAKFTYQHLLSQINFAVGGHKGAIISISNIHMGNIYDKGTYDFGTGEWIIKPEGNGMYDYYIEVDTPDAMPGQTTGVSDTEEVFFGNHHVGDTKDTKHNNSLMLLPQSFDKGQNEDAWFECDYLVQNMDGKTVVKSESDVRVYLKDIPFSDGAAWTKGKRYRYTIRFNDMNVIRYTVDVDLWPEDNQGETTRN